MTEEKKGRISTFIKKKDLVQLAKDRGEKEEDDDDERKKGNGNGIKEPTRVHRIQIGVLSVPTPKEEINAIWDFPVLSYGAPFDPTK